MLKKLGPIPIATFKCTMPTGTYHTSTIKIFSLSYVLINDYYYFSSLYCRRHFWPTHCLNDLLDFDDDASRTTFQISSLESHCCFQTSLKSCNSVNPDDNSPPEEGLRFTHPVESTTVISQNASHDFLTS